MNHRKQLNLDTSILVNYVYTQLPENIESDRGSAKILEGDDFYTVIGGKAEGEFVRLCERRHELYEDVVKFLRGTDSDLVDYAPLSRDIHLSDNDKKHIRKDIQMSWYEMEKREQLSQLRRCVQDFELFRNQIPNQIVDQTYPKSSNPELQRRIESELEINHDCEIIVDAVEISNRHSISVLVAIDSDIISDTNSDAIRSIIEDLTGDPLIEIISAEDL
ncbi:hypothetical protein G9C85_09465 [Halorubellus sp. JP-L1]|uniref:hypothetical protein n=1 Tax=Halorubellus sp. JP-L1 TaxID=2715753 RepID=UPI001408E982|nr:hypothetical protein [Halorubellus sp. JP-L1]NHN41857.1 hypothetical protein [Halorubellus sp. JP-L1]